MTDSTLLEDRKEGWFYTGPLDPATAFAHKDRHVLIVTPDKHALGAFQVNLCDDPDDPEGSIAEFGGGPDLETAWRFALGAFFGPVDEEYLGDEWLLRTLGLVERWIADYRALDARRQALSDAWEDDPNPAALDSEGFDINEILAELADRAAPLLGSKSFTFRVD